MTRFSQLDVSLLSPDFRRLVLLNCTYILEKKQNFQWRASSGDGAPKLQISVPCRGRTCPDKSGCKVGIWSAEVGENALSASLQLSQDAFSNGPIALTFPRYRVLSNYIPPLSPSALALFLLSSGIAERNHSNRIANRNAMSLVDLTLAAICNKTLRAWNPQKSPNTVRCEVVTYLTQNAFSVWN